MFLLYNSAFDQLQYGLIKLKLYPVDTRRRFKVYKTSIRRLRRLKEVFFSSLQAFKEYICIYKERKGHAVEKNKQYLSSISSKQTCLKNEWENDGSDFLRVLYSVYQKIRTILFSYLLLTVTLKKDAALLL